MAWICVDSFDHYATADLTRKYTQVNAGSGAPTINTTNGRRGTQALRLTVTGLNNNIASGDVRKVPDSPAPSGARCIMGAAFKATGIVNLNVGTAEECAIFVIRYLTGSQCWLRLNTNGTLSVYRGSTLLGTTTAAITDSVMQYIEFDVLIDPTVGTVDVYIDGVPALNLSGVNTRGNSAGSAWDEFKLGAIRSAGTNTYNYYYDDFYVMDGTNYTTTLNGGINDTVTTITVTSAAVFPTSGNFRVRCGTEIMLCTGVSGNDLTMIRGYSGTTAASHSNGDSITANCPQGDVRIDAVYPTANGTNRDWTPSTGTDDYTVVDEALINSDTDYLTSSTVGHKVTMNFPNAPVTGADIVAVAVVGGIRKTDAGAAGTKAIVRLSGTDYTGTEKSFPITYFFRQTIFAEKPSDGGKFVDTDFNAAEFGLQKSS